MGRTRSWKIGDVVELRSSGGQGVKMVIDSLHEVATTDTTPDRTEAHCIYMDKNFKFCTCDVNVDVLALVATTDDDYTAPAPEPATAPTDIAPGTNKKAPPGNGKANTKTDAPDKGKSETTTDG